MKRNFMKIKAAIFFLLLLSVGFLKAQFRRIPAEVTDAFAKKFTGASRVTWKDNITNYEAGFLQNNISYSAKFNSKGEWLQTIKKMLFDELNADVKDGFNKSKYNDWQVRDVVEITSKDKEVFYRILVRKSSFGKTYLYFNTKGQLQKNNFAI